MCRELEKIYTEGRMEGRAEGRAEGRVEGIAEGIVSSIKSLMETLGLPIEAAMDALKIPKSEQHTYAELLEKR